MNNNNVPKIVSSIDIKTVSFDKEKNETYCPPELVDRIVALTRDLEGLRVLTENKEFLALFDTKPD